MVYFTFLLCFSDIQYKINGTSMIILYYFLGLQSE